MNSIESRSPAEKGYPFSWWRFLLDSVLAIVGVMGITSIISVFHLYPRIPNISMIYLLIVLPLAVTRGRYSATLASIAAFLTFDFFIVPPLYTFVMYHVEEWIALIVFLLNALLIGYLAAALRQRAIEASRRERETRTLYNLVRVTSTKETPEEQVSAISQAIVNVFSSWGVQGCSILLPDTSGVLQVQVDASWTIEEPFQSTSEQTDTTDVTILSWPKKNRGKQPGKALNPLLQHLFANAFSPREHSTERSIHLIPLKLGQKAIGTLRLHVQGSPQALLQAERLAEENASAVSSSFFWTYLGQVAALLERAHLQRENLRLAILQRTDTLRAALLSSVSHDLRTPLTAIKAAASSLLQEEIEWHKEAQNGFLQSIEREADRLNRLVANLLDMSRIEEGALKPDKDWYSLKALIHDVLGRLEQLLEGRTISASLPDDLLLVELDYLEIDQVLTNLLENAVRYTPAGTPIEISARQEGEQVMVSVTDHGPGISTEQLERVFDKFYRVLQETPPGTGVIRGSGLGLAVCKGLVEAHGGRIWARPGADGGLIVSIVLPVGERERMPL